MNEWLKQAVHFHSKLASKIFLILSAPDFELTFLRQSPSPLPKIHMQSGAVSDRITKLPSY